MALAPGGFRRTYGDMFTRIVVAFQDSKESRNALLESVRMAQTQGLPLSTVTVLQRHRMYGSNLGSAAEDTVLAQLEADTVARQEELLSGLPDELEVTSEIAIADTITSALQQLRWDGNELLVLSSAHGGRLKRVFLGDMTYKLVRASPVPTVVLPRRT